MLLLTFSHATVCVCACVLFRSMRRLCWVELSWDVGRLGGTGLMCEKLFGVLFVVVYCMFYGMKCGV